MKVCEAVRRLKQLEDEWDALHMGACGLALEVYSGENTHNNRTNLDEMIEERDAIAAEIAVLKHRWVEKS